MGKDAAFLRYLEYLTGRTAVRLYTVQFGVWTLAIREKPRSFAPSLPSLEDAKHLLRRFSPTWTFVKDIYRIAPRQFTVLRPLQRMDELRDRIVTLHLWTAEELGPCSFFAIIDI